MSRDLDVVTLTGAEYDALTQRADDWYALYARASKERAAALEDVERWKRAAESNIEENVGLRLAEEGAKEAFGHVVQQKRDLEAECKRLRGLLDGAYDTIRQQAPNAIGQEPCAGVCARSPGDFERRGNMSAQRDYWQECIAIAAEECDLTLTPEQLDYLASSAEAGHEHYGQAFYSPPASDRLNEIEREWKAKLKAQQDEHERYMRNAETAVKQALRVHRDDQVTIGSYGEVLRHGGRTVRIQ